VLFDNLVMVRVASKNKMRLSSNRQA